MSKQKEALLIVYKLSSILQDSEPDVGEAADLTEQLYFIMNRMWPNLAQEIQNEIAEELDEDETEDED